MGRNKKGEPPSVRVYTVCDESRYLIVRNVPALGCIDELVKLFGSYGPIDECRYMDEEESEPYTDVCWIKYVQVSNARFAKRKLDEHVFFGNRLQVFYAPQYESLSDTKEKLEVRRKEVLSRLNSGQPKMPKSQGSKSRCNPDIFVGPLLAPSHSQTSFVLPQIASYDGVSVESAREEGLEDSPVRRLPSQEYFSSSSMNETVQLVREKLDEGKRMLQ
ncbi:hypothetical protein AMTR_s00096p00065500 [Amborella trichopoda]|uniref:RNA-binding protein 48 n=1 Tax=Amborella trichopoda TaxID=13333 RepID=W1P452_AMBTC|nr:hypothetical protein AMTR_s00096p00065500 [Amborella trichopoda]